LVCLAVAAGAAAAQETTVDSEGRLVVRGAQLGARARARSVDVDLRDLPLVHDWQPGDPIKEIPRRAYPRPGQQAEGRPLRTPLADPLPEVQAAAPPSELFQSVLNMDGQAFSGVNPPDTVGDVGPSHYIQAINHSSGTSFVVYNKAGAVLAGPSFLDALGSGNCANGLGDPVVLWDSLANRWLISEFSSAGNQLCVYVSKTADPVSGGWWAYAFTAPSFPDYPKYAVWPDAYYVSSNEGTGSPVYALDRANMLNGAAARPFQRFTAPDMAGFSFQALTPADLDGPTAPPAGAAGIFMRHRDDEAHNAGSNNPSQDFLEVWQLQVNWTTPASSTFTQVATVAVAEFDSSLCGLTSFSCVPQPGSSTRLDPLREVIMNRLAYRRFAGHEALVGNLSTDVNGADRAGIRWFELRRTTGAWTLHQQGTYSPGTPHRWMGGSAMDGQGNIALAYNVSDPGASVFPGLRYAGRLATDPLGTLPQAETVLVNGSAANASNRYGDYAAMGIDPSDDCTFWFTGMYNPSSSWRTRIGAFKFDTCGGGTPTPDFTVSAAPASVTVVQGGSGTSTVTVGSLNGFSAAVGLTASGLPGGVTASFAPSSVTPPAGGSAASTLTLTASASASAGTFTVTVTGTSGALTHATSLSLTVNAVGGAAFDPVLQAPRCSAVGPSCDSGVLLNGRDGKGPEPNQPNTINDSCADGTSGTYHSDESNDRLRVATLDGTPLAAGKVVQVTATVWAWTTPAQDKLDLYYAANADSPSWTFITTLTPTAAGAQAMSATYTLPAGTLQAVRARFRYQGSAAACGTGAYDDHDDLVFAVGAPAADTTPPTTSITAPAGGATVSGAVNVTASASDNVGVTRVEFYLDGALQSTDTTAPYAWSWNSASTPNGGHSLQSRAYDAAGNVGSSALVNVTVSNGGLVTATFDSVLQAPRCSTVGFGCDSGATLVNGRDGRGPEPNQPNTINDSCQDGTSGTFHVDESNDRLKVETVDGTPLAAGKTVRITATVWAWTTPSADKLDLFYAANANSPAWTYITTLTPTAAGAQTLSATYTLPAGTLQAVRAQFRYNSTTAACSAGGYNDRDDLVFAVQ
jgi:hypothetical protein